MIPSDFYLEELAREANERFRGNERKLRGLEEAVRVGLFCQEEDQVDDAAIISIIDPVGSTTLRVKDNIYSSSSMPSSINLSHNHPLSNLNLWGHAAVAIPHPGTTTDTTTT